MNRSVALTLIALLSLTVYWVSLDYDFALDDYVQIVRNELVTEPSVTIQEIFSKPVFPGNLYRPLLISSYRITHNVVGLNPFYFHLTNLILHSFISIFIFLLLSRIDITKNIALLTTILFAVHPIHVEAVVNISGRSELLCHFFGLLGILVLTQEKNCRRFLPQVLFGSCLLLAMLTKESGIAYIWLTFLVLLFSDVNWIGAARRVLPTSILALLCYGTLRWQAIGSILSHDIIIDYLDNPLAHSDTLTRIFSALFLLGKGFVLSLMPLNLSSDYSFSKLSPLSPSLSTLLSPEFLSILVLLLLSLFAIKRKELFSFSAIWFFASTFIASNLLFATGTIFADRLFYLPSLSSALILSAILSSLPLTLIRIVLGLLLIIGYSAKTHTESLYWKNNDSLFTAEVIRSSESAKAQFNYGMLLLKKGDIQNAASSINKALSIYPQFADAHHGLGMLANARQDFTQAKIHFTEALKLSPTHPATNYELGVLLFNNGDTDTASKHFEIMLENNPRNFYGLLGRMMVLIRKGKLQDAQAIYQELYRRDPKNPGLINLKQQLSVK